MDIREIAQRPTITPNTSFYVFYATNSFPRTMPMAHPRSPTPLAARLLNPSVNTLLNTTRKKMILKTLSKTEVFRAPSHH